MVDLLVAVCCFASSPVSFGFGYCVLRWQVWRENMTFFRDKHLFACAYARFLWQLLHTQEGPCTHRPPSYHHSVLAIPMSLAQQR